MRVLVTRAAGFVGSQVVRCLLDAVAEVVGIDGLTDDYAPAIKRRDVSHLLDHDDIEIVPGDLVSGGWQQHLNGVEVVFYHAAESGSRASWSAGFQDYTSSNVLATQRLLDGAIEVVPLGDFPEALAAVGESSPTGDSLLLVGYDLGEAAGTHAEALSVPRTVRDRPVRNRSLRCSSPGQQRFTATRL